MRQMERDMARYGGEKERRGKEKREKRGSAEDEEEKEGGQKRHREECRAKLPGRARADKAPCVRA